MSAGAVPAGQAVRPLFPLDTVLFPGAALPLRIFERRYLDMVRRCVQEDSAFVVLRLQAGAEAGEAAEVASVGCEARIVDFDSLPGGLLGITCRGGRRVRLLERWRDADGLNRGVIAVLPEVSPVPMVARHERLAVLLRALLPQVPEHHPREGWQLDDAGWVAARLGELLPLPVTDRQQLLELDDPLGQLDFLAARVRIRERLPRD
ncbi:MAG: hypothetical protein RL026_2081 [Pseudomonadota bacterium]|jgi:Lon protease-like protein